MLGAIGWFVRPLLSISTKRLGFGLQAQEPCLVTLDSWQDAYAPWMVSRSRITSVPRCTACAGNFSGPWDWILVVAIVSWLAGYLCTACIPEKKIERTVTFPSPIVFASPRGTKTYPIEVIQLVDAGTRRKPLFFHRVRYIARPTRSDSRLCR